MSRTFQIIFVLLCIAAIFITGIPLAKYLSKQYFQLRSELNSQGINLKYSSHANRSPAAANVESHNENQNAEFLHVDTKETDFRKLDTLPDAIASSLQKHVKVKRRSKRGVSYQNNKDIVSWNLNLNVTRNLNNTLEETSKSISDIPLENKHLEVAVYAEGKAQKQTALDELQNVLKSIETFITNFFANTTKNTTYQELEINQIPPGYFEKGSVRTESEVHTQNLNNIKLGTEMSEKPSSQKGREGKFILEFLGFGGKRLGETTRISEEGIVSTEHGNSIDFQKNGESLENIISLKTEFVTENSQKERNFHSESLASKPISPSTVFEGLDSMSQFNVRETTEQIGCSDCLVKDFELSDSANEIKETTNIAISETIPTTESLFTDEVLEKFCMSLVNKLEESQQLSDEKGNDFDSELNTQNENQLRSSQNPSILDLLALFNSLKGNESNPDSAVIEDSFLNSDMSESQTTVARQSRFLNFNNIFGFGSGRSAIVEDESIDPFSEGLDESIDTENLPSISDCENYFRKKQSMKMFPKPNLMDMMSDPKIQLVDFANATISSKLKEQQLQFLTDLLKTNLNNSVEAFDNNLEDTVKKPETDEENTSPGKEIFSINEKHSASKDKEIANQTESNDFNWSKLTDASANSNTGIQQATEMPRNGRFFPIFGLGSGSDESPRSSESRLFLSFFGSGERLFETTDTATKSGRSGEFGSGEAFRDHTVFPDDIQTLRVSEDFREEGTTPIQERRFWGFLGFAGSGDGRELSEGVELVPSEFTSFTENECVNDCSHENSETVQSHDCNDCNFESLNITNAEFKEDGVKNESECEDCYFSNITHDDYKIFESDNNETINLDENITTENLHGTHENCNCFKKNSGKNISFSECDDCGSSVLEPPDDSLKISKSYQSKVISEYANQTPSAEDQGNDCDDCDYKSYLHNTKAINSDREMTSSECEECNSVIGTPAVYHEFTEDNQSTEHISIDLNKSEKDYENVLLSVGQTHSHRENSFEECDECNTNVIDAPVESYKTQNYQSTKGISEDLSKTESQQDYENNLHTENQVDSDGEMTPHQSYRTTANYQYTAILEDINKNDQTMSTQDIENLYSKTQINEIIPATEILKPNFIDTNADVGDIKSVNNYVTENPYDQQTTEIIPGSGDESLFEGNAGLINLVEEETTIISPAVFPRRRARLEDSGEPCYDCNVDISEIVKKNAKEFEQINPVQENTSSKSPELFERHSVNVTGAAISSEIFPNSIQSFTDVSKPTALQPRFCTSASECNSTLNERCITIISSSVCGCDRAFVRHKETNKCVVKRIVETSLKLPAEKFDDDLENPLSSKYKRMRKNAVDTMWLLLHDNPELLPIIAEVDLAGFREGSLIVSWNLVFAVESESEAKLVKDIEGDLQKALKDENLMKSASLDVSNASVLSLNSEIDPCKSSELNYCSKNAYCIWNEAFRGRFACYCKEHYRDNSSDPLYTGETCIVKCPPEYCGSNGHCEILENGERHCLCSGLYFGKNCEVPGMYVFGILAMFASISIGVVIAVASKNRCTTRSYGGPQTFGRSQESGTNTHMNGRVSDAIALEENIGSQVTKYANISTPMKDLPVIKVTRPTLHESSLSFECDSTFDVTPTRSNEKEQNTSTV